MLTRAEVAKMLDSHKTTVRRLESKGLLEPVLIDGVHYFARSNVARALQARPHAISGPAFALFKAGKEPADVVIELCAEPDHIRALWTSYKQLEGCWVIQGPGSLRAWEPIYQLGELTPEKLLQALELVCADPELRRLLKQGPVRRAPEPPNS